MPVTHGTRSSILKVRFEICKMASVAFSSDTSGVIERKVLTGNNQVRTTEDVQNFFEVDRCVQWIQENDFKRVALQFPDELLGDSTHVTSNLERRTGVNVFIMGDTSYGSCCVDEVSAQHYNADAIIHYGRACLSITDRLPVLYVFGKSPVDVTDCVEKTSEIITDTSAKLILMYDVIYSHVIDDIKSQLSLRFSNLLLSKLQENDCKPVDKREELLKEEVSSSTSFSRCRRTINIPNDFDLKDYSVLFIGGEGLTLTNLMMNFNKCQFFTYTPLTKIARKETLNLNRALMKRYYLIEKAKDAQIVGIVVGTLGVKNYVSAINRLKELLRKAGMKSYTFVVGKLNVAKLANFMEIDIFVLVSCSENSLINSSEFYKPVVTPFEMEIACNTAREWTGDYLTDFSELLPGAVGHVPLPDHIPEVDRNAVSLITGKLRSHGVEEMAVDENSTALLSRDDVLTVSTAGNSAANFMSDRSWKGLERNLGETSVTKAVEGQKGIAASYKNETTNS